MNKQRGSAMAEGPRCYSRNSATT